MRAKVTISIFLEEQLHLWNDLLVEHGICHVGSHTQGSAPL